MVTIVIVYENSFHHDATPYFSNPSDQVSLFFISASVIVSVAALTAIYAHSVEKAVIEADRAVELERAHHDLAEAHQKLTEAYDRLEDLATHDPITGLINHRMIKTLLTQCLQEQQAVDTPIAVIFADIDHFKQINDTWGHAIGDLALTHVAQCLERHMSLSHHVARYGGEEFVAVLPRHPLPQAHMIAERLRSGVATTPLIMPGGESLSMTVSVGVAVAEHDLQTVDQLLQAADKAMYQAKHAGRNRVCLATPPQDDYSTETPQPQQPYDIPNMTAA